MSASGKARKTSQNGSWVITDLDKQRSARLCSSRMSLTGHGRQGLALASFPAGFQATISPQTQQSPNNPNNRSGFDAAGS